MENQEKKESEKSAVVQSANKFVNDFMEANEEGIKAGKTTLVVSSCEEGVDASFAIMGDHGLVVGALCAAIHEQPALLQLFKDVVETYKRGQEFMDMLGKEGAEALVESLKKKTKSNVN